MPDRTFTNTQALPTFPHTSQDDEREAWAVSHPAGYFFVITTRYSFDRLPEYRQWQADSSRRAASLPSTASIDFRQARSSTSRALPPALDARSVFVPYFEETTSPSPQPQPPPISTHPHFAPISMSRTHHTSVSPATQQVSPLDSQFSGLMHSMTTQQYPYEQLPFQFTQPAFADHMAGFNSGFTISVPPPSSYTSHFEPQSAPALGPVGGFWSDMNPHQRPEMGPRSRSFYEDMIGRVSRQH